MKNVALPVRIVPKIFTDHYNNHPIFEGSVQLIDMVYLQKKYNFALSRQHKRSLCRFIIGGGSVLVISLVWTEIAASYTPAACSLWHF